MRCIHSKGNTGVQGEKILHVSSKERGKPERDKRRNKPTKNNQSSPMRRREEHVEEQNKVNEEKDINIQRQETEVVTGGENVGKGTIKIIGTQGEISTKSKEEKETKKKRDKGK